jgi:hypothetical protein
MELPYCLDAAVEKCLQHLGLLLQSAFDDRHDFFAFRVLLRIGWAQKNLVFLPLLAIDDALIVSRLLQPACLRASAVGMKIFAQPLLASGHLRQLRSRPREGAPVTGEHEGIR